MEVRDLAEIYQKDSQVDWEGLAEQDGRGFLDEAEKLNHLIYSKYESSFPMGREEFLGVVIQSLEESSSFAQFLEILASESL